MYGHKLREKPKTKGSSKFAALREARNSGRAKYKVDEDTNIYDEVDDTEFKKIVRERLNNDDFVVDDNGEGYIDNGIDEWDSNNNKHKNSYGYSSDFNSDSDLESNSKGRKKRRKERDDLNSNNKKNKKTYDLKSYFSGAPKNSINTTGSNLNKIPTMKTTTEEDKNFMDNLLNEIEQSDDISILSSTTKSSASNLKFKNIRKTQKNFITKKTNTFTKPFSRNEKTNNFKRTISSSPPLNAFENSDLNNDFDDDINLNINTPITSPLDTNYKSDNKLLDSSNKNDQNHDQTNSSQKSIEDIEDIIKNESSDDEELQISRPTGILDNTKKVNIKSSRIIYSEPKNAETNKFENTPSSSDSSDIDPSLWIKANESIPVASEMSIASSPSSKRHIDEEEIQLKDEKVEFFWMDYTEVNNLLILFGKIKINSSNGDKFVSAMLKINNINRKMYFLPRTHPLDNKDSTQIKTMDLYDEVKELLQKRHISRFLCKPATMKYAFDQPDVPQTAEYLEVLYPYSDAQLPQDLSGNTFSKVFGTNSPIFERFVLDKQIMGPCWLNLSKPDFQSAINSSWCKAEIAIPGIECIEVIQESGNIGLPPPVTFSSVSIRTTLNREKNRQEIVAISVRTFENIQHDTDIPAEELKPKLVTLIRPVDGTIFPPGFEKTARKRQGHKIMPCKNETMLLNLFLNTIQRLDPDIIMGHQLENVDLPVLLHRMRDLKIRLWSCMGRLRRTEFPKIFGKSGTLFAERQIAAGRLMVDIANELGKSLTTKCQSWSLTEMVELILSTKRIDIESDAALYANTSQSSKDLFDYLEHCALDTHNVAAIALKIQIMSLSKQLTNLAGNSWARTLTGTRAERNEFILLHEFTKKGYVVPDKYNFMNSGGKMKDKLYAGHSGVSAEGNMSDDENQEIQHQYSGKNKKKDKYKGGLVFEPERGLYDNFVLVMDFNSLYPSIIQEYNICFTTVQWATLAQKSALNDSNTESVEELIPEVPPASQPQGILPRLISTLVQRRREVKKLLKNEINATKLQKAQWDAKQMALKLTANSMYGCLGYARSRFYARPLAMLTTFKGREILMNTRELAESMKLQVVYGDTDSVMINTHVNDYKEAVIIGNNFKSQVNNRYKMLEIDIDNVFKRLLLHAKKKYAALNMIEKDGQFFTQIEVKGLDMKRREYCALSKEVSKYCLQQILSGETTDIVLESIHEYLEKLAEQVREHKVPAQKMIIYTKLGKNPKDYPNDGKGMPQVKVALRRLEKERIQAGDVISYIIATPDNPEAILSAVNNPTEHAYTYAEVQAQKDPQLYPTAEWYLAKQILPPIERLCAPIPGTDAMRLASCLGLDARKYGSFGNGNGGMSGAEKSFLEELTPLESTIEDCDRFKECKKLILECLKCSTQFMYTGLIDYSINDEDDNNNNLKAEFHIDGGISCPKCKEIISILSISAQVSTFIRQEIKKYYEMWLLCSDSTCGIRTRQMSVYGRRCLGPLRLCQGCRGVMKLEYNDTSIYTQILYICNLFDFNRTIEQIRSGRKGVISAIENSGQKPEDVLKTAEFNKERFFNTLNTAKGYLDNCARRFVDMHSLFFWAQPKKA